MKIKGIQKTTLIDYPQKIACTLFLFGCNFRCGFCHNPELVLKEEGKTFSEEEILDFLEKRKNQLDGVCITGGEPLMSLDKNFLRKIKNLGYLIKIDTNGCFPEKLKEIIDEGLVDFVAMDVKSDKNNYEKIVGVKVDFQDIERSIKLISEMENYEFRMTIIKELGEEEIKNLSVWLGEVCRKKPKMFCLQGFKKEEKMIDEKFQEQRNTTKEELDELKNSIKNYFENVEVRV